MGKKEIHCYFSLIFFLACVPKKLQITALQPGYNVFLSVKEFKPNIHELAKIGEFAELPPEEVEGKLTADGYYIYVVKVGDTLYKISRKLFGNGQLWPKLYLRNKARNRRKDPDFLEVGMRLYYVK